MIRKIKVMNIYSDKNRCLFYTIRGFLIFVEKIKVFKHKEKWYTVV